MTRSSVYRAFALVATIGLIGPLGFQAVAEEACEASCNATCNPLPAAEKKGCKLACFAGRCGNPGALNVAEASGEAGISCASDAVCNGFCEEGPVADSDCFAFIAGHVGFAIEIYLNGVKQFFTADQLSNREGIATQDEAGVVLLSILPCTTHGCDRHATLNADVAGPLSAGTTINFKVLHTTGLPLDGPGGALCGVSGVPPGVSPHTLGNHFVTLSEDDPDGVNIHCTVESDFD